MFIGVNRKGQEIVLEIQQELESSRERETFAHEKLSSALRKVDRVTTEKNTFAKIVQTRSECLQSFIFFYFLQADAQKKTAERAMASELENSMTIGNLERKLEQYEETLNELDRSSAR